MQQLLQHQQHNKQPSSISFSSGNLVKMDKKQGFFSSLKHEVVRFPIPIPVRLPIETSSEPEHEQEEDDGPLTSLSLSLSLPGVDTSDVVNRPTLVPTPISASPISVVTASVAAKVSQEVGIRALNLSKEFTVVMQEMIKNEVRSYMEEQNGMCFQGVDRLRNVSAKPIGINVNGVDS